MICHSWSLKKSEVHIEGILCFLFKGKWAGAQGARGVLILEMAKFPWGQYPPTPSSPLKMIILVMYKSSQRHDRVCVVHHGQQNDGSLHWVSIPREMRSNTRDQGSVAYGDTTDDGILSHGMRIQKYYRSRTSNLLYTFLFSPSICGEECTT